MPKKHGEAHVRRFFAEADLFLIVTAKHKGYRFPFARSWPKPVTRPLALNVRFADAAAGVILRYDVAFDPEQPSTDLDSQLCQRTKIFRGNVLLLKR